MDIDLNLDNIKPLISNDLLKTVLDEFNVLISKISNRYGISVSDLNDFLKDDISKLGVKLGIKKRNRRVLPPEKQCMGRKLDGNQCTRGRHSVTSEFCKSHANKLPLGRIDDVCTHVNEFQKDKKRKNSKKSSEYILTRIDTINNVNYLVDDRQFVYSFNTETPEFLGVKVDNTIKTLEQLGIKVC